MAYIQLSRTTPVIEAWQDITDEQNDAQTVAIYDVIGKHGGNVLTVGFSPTHANLVSVIEYPDELSAQKSVAGILALRTLEFQSIEQLWDVVAWVSLVREANQAR
jgi:phosphohistidine phosphatase SixA